MRITFQQLLSLLPLLIIGVTVLIVMLCIAWRRNHFASASLTFIGLNLAFFSLWFVTQHNPVDITPLIRVDSLSIFYSGLVLIASIVTIILSYSWLSDYPGNRDEFYLLILIATIGGVLLTTTNHLATLFLGIELISLPLFGLIGYSLRHKHALEASIKYTLLSAVASSFLLFGTALIYAKTGQLSFVSLGQTINNDILNNPILLTGLGMMLVGLFFKLSLVPFHLWTPDVYQGSPAPATIFLATASKIAIFTAVLRLFLYIPFTHNNMVQLVLAITAFFSILLGNLMPLSQNNLKRVLSCSSIAHIGHVLLCLIVVQTDTLALETIGIYQTGYLLASLGAFGVISLMSNNDHQKDTDLLFSYRGLFWHKPILSFVLTIMMLSLAGIPMTLGFISKFYVIALCIKNHLVWLTIIVIGSSSIGLFYYLRIIITLYLSPSPKHSHKDTSFNWALTAGNIVILILALLILILGLYPEPLITFINLIIAKTLSK